MAKEIITNTTVNPVLDTVVFFNLKNDINKSITSDLNKDVDYPVYNQKLAVNQHLSEKVTGETDTPVELNPVGVSQTVLKALYNLTFYNHCIYQ